MSIFDIFFLKNNLFNFCRCDQIHWERQLDEFNTKNHNDNNYFIIKEGHGLFAQRQNHWSISDFFFNILLYPHWTNQHDWSYLSLLQMVWMKSLCFILKRRKGKNMNINRGDYGSQVESELVIDVDNVIMLKNGFEEGVEILLLFFFLEREGDILFYKNILD
ncbi:hypothetical protein RFI_32709 [Reticulomyxa filosa]|uniref:Uncharacterized protein n=1 Tax=Reticulomyxa filosa TaxID=46433 RepID=X6LU64_RETFI|nr:hypothetical protein RFI_32709 [Reticulomyxa filosa]|eukprot:ETO04687.1 hypothetical protein RFI_32709 [Reticulomyxa filosa]